MKSTFELIFATTLIILALIFNATDRLQKQSLRSPATLATPQQVEFIKRANKRMLTQTPERSPELED